MTPVVLYARQVARQDEQTVLAQLRAAATAHGWHIIAEHTDPVPAETPMADREHWPTVRTLIERGEARIIVVPQRNHCGWTTADDRRLDELLLDHGARLYPLSASAGCCRCERMTEAPVVVRVLDHGSGPGAAVYACPDCAPRLAPGPTDGEGTTAPLGAPR